MRTVSNILFRIAFGLVADTIAKLLGVLGAFTGGFLYTTLTHRPHVARLDLGSALVTLGAAVVLLAYPLLTGGRAQDHYQTTVPNKPSKAA